MSNSYDCRGNGFNAIVLLYYTASAIVFVVGVASLNVPAIILAIVALKIAPNPGYIVHCDPSSPLILDLYGDGVEAAELSDTNRLSIN